MGSLGFVGSSPGTGPFKVMSHMTDAPEILDFADMQAAKGQDESGIRNMSKVTGCRYSGQHGPPVTCPENQQKQRFVQQRGTGGKKRARGGVIRRFCVMANVLFCDDQSGTGRLA